MRSETPALLRSIFERSCIVTTTLHGICRLSLLSVKVWIWALVDTVTWVNFHNDRETLPTKVCRTWTLEFTEFVHFRHHDESNIRVRAWGCCSWDRSGCLAGYHQLLQRLLSVGQWWRRVEHRFTARWLTVKQGFRNSSEWTASCWHKPDRWD